jgi:hypothetical protein
LVDILVRHIENYNSGTRLLKQNMTSSNSSNATSCFPLCLLS